MSPGSAAPERRAKRVGHKGAHHLAHGNTLESFRAALDHGVDMIEFDVLPAHLDGTGELLLGHDYGDLSRRTASTLDEGLAHLAGPEYAAIEFDVDLKLPGYEERAIAALRRHGLAERALISTMEPESLVLIRELDPDIRLGRSFPKVRSDPMGHWLKRWPAYALIAYWRRALPARIAAQLGAGEVDALMCHWAFVTPRLARAVQDAGGELYVWTVDEADRIADLERLGVDGIITNDPRLFDATAGAPAPTH
ncbi:MAG TPA: glycerophosphodiester phosphodiesterase [Solirubrobacteraceae bacterium]|nr:glycerophosphodiester phosphodiesterase [Solirubrobacteraceae bacterium]